MTAVPDWDVVGPTDAELAGAACTGDRGAFAQIYARYADRLHDFCVGMLRDGDAAADCVQDAFCIAATRLVGLREPDKLRPWLYAIARNEALRRIRERRRERVSDELPDTASTEPGPEALAARSELADLIAEAAGGLSDRDRTVLELAYRHGLDGPELAQAMGISHSSAKKLVVRLRETIERSLGALLVARRARAATNGCPELGAILDGWDGQFSVLMRKRVARHIESCPACDEERRELVNPVALLGGVPVFIPAPGWLREHTLNQVRLPGATTSTPPDKDNGNAPESGAEPPPDAASAARPDSADGRGIRRLTLVAALLVGTLLVAAGLTIAWWYRPHPAFAPSDVSKTAPAPGAPRILESTPTTTPTPGTTPASSSVAPPPPSAGPTAPATLSTNPTTTPVAPPPSVRPPITPPASTGPTSVPVAPPPPAGPPAPPPTSKPPSTVPTGIVPSHGAPRPTATTSPPTLF